MTLAFVTCLYDLAKRGSTEHRTIDWMFANSAFVLELDHHLVVFTEPELEAEIRKRRGDRPTTIVLMPYEALLTHERYIGAHRGQLQGNATRTKVTPAYVALMWAKYGMLQHAIKTIGANFTHIGWIDFAITHVAKVTPGLANKVFAQPSDAPRVHMLRYFDATDTIVPVYWHTVWGHLAGGLVVGSVPRMENLAIAFWYAVDIAIANGLSPLDEGLLTYVIAQQPDQFTYSYGDYVDIVRNHDSLRGGVEHLWFQMEDAHARGAIDHIHNLKIAIAAALKARQLDDADGPTLAKLCTEFGAPSKAPPMAEAMAKAASALGLVMIVKNEAHGIAKTLESFRSVIGSWTILDTGSTDGTQDVIRKVLDGIPGQLVEEPFVNFAVSRNRALELHGTQSTFTIMPDADDVLVEPSALALFLGAAVDDAEPAYLVNIDRPPLSYWLPLVRRSKDAWIYRGVVHEYLGPPEGSRFATVRIPGVRVSQDRPPASHDATQKRWRRDLELLRNEFIANPKDPRTLFYLAQTHECLDQKEEALAVYERRIEVGGWVEETFEAALRRAKLLHALNRPWPVVEEAFYAAFLHDTRRAEPLFHIAQHWYDKQIHALAYMFAAAAASRKPVESALFLDAEIYQWRAAHIAAISGYYCDHLNDPKIKIDGRRFAEAVVRARPGDEQARANWAFYAPSAHDLFGGYHSQPIELSPPEPYVANNPSVFYDADRQQWMCLVRSTNYRIINGQYLTPDDNVIFTRNWMLELDDDLRTTRAVEMRDRAPNPRTGYPVHGFEDCRLFKIGGTFYASSTVCDFTEAGDREITIIELDRNDYGIVKAWPVRGPWSRHAQKNWMPVVDGDRLRFIYATIDPTSVFDAKFDAQHDRWTLDLQGTTMLGHGRLRGGSQAVRVPEGWLFITHDVAWPGQNARIYLHRFVLMNPEFVVLSMSDPFYFERRGIEFCAGLAYDGKKLVASFGVEDRVAHFGVFDLDAVRAKLRRDFQV